MACSTTTSIFCRSPSASTNSPGNSRRCCRIEFRSRRSRCRRPSGNDCGRRALNRVETRQRRTNMPKDAHHKAAEHHETAAKSHRMAAEHHGKGDHAKGREESSKAHSHSKTAHEHSDAAHTKSQTHK